jgi:hypothetical protein
LIHVLQFRPPLLPPPPQPLPFLSLWLLLLPHLRRQ